MCSVKLRKLVCSTALASPQARANFPGTNAEWEKTWEKLSQPGTYEVEGADLMVAGLAHCLTVNFMILNTAKNSTPFSFVAADVWGGPSTKSPPLLLVYDGSHYETVVAETKKDETFCTELFIEWKNNDFKLSHQDIANAKLDSRTDTEAGLPSTLSTKNSGAYGDNTNICATGTTIFHVSCANFYNIKPKLTSKLRCGYQTEA